jgi:hypothetical protein
MHLFVLVLVLVLVWVRAVSNHGYLNIMESGIIRLNTNRNLKLTGISNNKHTERLIFGLSMALPLCLYWWTLPRGLTLEDAGLFQLVCHQGGISHPPGYPLFTIACQAFVGLSWFDNPIVPGNLLSAIFASGGCGMLFLIVRRFGLSITAALVASLAYGFSNAFWSQAIIIEVYSLGVLTFLISFYCGLRFSEQGERRWLYYLALSYGLALSNHWPIVVLSSPAILLVMLNQWQAFLMCLRSISFWLVCLLLLLLGLSPYLTLLQANPEIAVYGPNHTFADLLRYVNRSMYSDVKIGATTWDKWQYSLWLWSHSNQQLGLFCLPVILLGLIQSFRRWSIWYATGLVFMYLATTQILNLLLGFTFEYRYQSIFHPYPLIAYVSLAIWLGLGADQLSDWLRNKKVAGHYVMLFCLSLPLGALITNYGQNTRAQTQFVELYGRTLLEALPENSVLFTYGDFEVDVLFYLQQVEGVRPDIEIREWYNLVLSNRLTSPWASHDEQDKVRRVFIAEETRPVFSVREWDVPRVNNGLFYRLEDTPDRRAEYVAGFEPLLDMTLDAYNNQLFWNAQEQELAYSIIARFGRHYTMLLLDDQGLPTVVVPRYEAVRNTLPGGLAVLEILLSSQHGPSAKTELLRLIEQLLQKPDEALFRFDVAQLYYFYGYALSLEPADEAASQAAYQKAYDSFPGRDNPAYCKVPAHAEQCRANAVE